MAINAPTGYSGVLYYLNYRQPPATAIPAITQTPLRPATTVAPIPSGTPLRTSLPARTTAPISQPNAPVLYRPPTPAPAPVAAPVTVPISPISGAPVQTSVFQPSQTTASILQQSQTPMFGGSNYQEPQSPITPATPPQSFVDTSQQQQTGLFGLDQNSIIVILVILAALIAMAVS